MEFTNLTPFSALNYVGCDTEDREYEVVTMCAEYRLVVSNNKVSRLSDFRHIQRVFMTEANEDDPIDLCMADEFYDEPNTSSIWQESDIIPYKAKCDILIRGHAYSSKPTPAFKASVALYRQEGDTPTAPLEALINKELWLTGPRHWQRVSSQTPTHISNFSSHYRLTDSALVQKLPLRYEYALGGSCRATHANQTSDTQHADRKHPEQLYHEVCYRNPIGRGWFETDYFNTLKNFDLLLPESFAAPQIMPQGMIYKYPLITEQQGAMTAFEMAELTYTGAAAGFSALHRSWAPRLAKAGTYDDDWLTNRHPYLPKDFNFNYYNAAPADQQIDFPDLTKPHTLLINNLIEGGGYDAILLPRHRALALVKVDGFNLPFPMQVDTIIFDSDHQTLKLVWRMAVLSDMEPEAIETRFITDPEDPWLTFD